MVAEDATESGQFTTFYLAILVPSLLLLASCVIRNAGIARALQAFGSGLLLVWWCWLLSKSEYPSITVSTAILFLGLTCYTFHESWWLERQRGYDRAGLRGPIALQVIYFVDRLAGEVFALYFSMSVSHQSLKESWHPTAGSILLRGALLGLFITFIWCVWRGRKGAPWLGIVVAIVPLFLGMWLLGRQLASKEDYMSGLRLTLLCSSIPRLLCLVAVFLALAQHLWRSRQKMPAK